MHVETPFPTLPRTGAGIYLPALRLLELSSQSPYGVLLGRCVATFDVPRLRAPSLSPGAPPRCVFHSQLQPITSLKIYDSCPLHGVDLRNVTRVYMTVHPAMGLPRLSDASRFSASSGWGPTCPRRHGAGRAGRPATSGSWHSPSVPPRCPRSRSSDSTGRTADRRLGRDGRRSLGFCGFFPARDCALRAAGGRADRAAVRLVAYPDEHAEYCGLIQGKGRGGACTC